MKPYKEMTREELMQERQRWKQDIKSFRIRE